MELNEFVAETLRQVLSGVKTAQDHAETLGGAIAPRTSTTVRVIDTGMSAYQRIEFDVAVTTTEGTRKGGGVGVLIASVGLGAKRQVEQSNVVVSRLRFAVPVMLPLQETGDDSR